MQFTELLAAEEARRRQGVGEPAPHDPFNTSAFRVQAGDDNVTQITERNIGVARGVPDLPVQLRPAAARAAAAARQTAGRALASRRRNCCHPDA